MKYLLAILAIAMLTITLSGCATMQPATPKVEKSYVRTGFFVLGRDKEGKNIFDEVLIDKETGGLYLYKAPQRTYWNEAEKPAENKDATKE